ncbi:hypothetical protein K6V98_03500 [Collinsella sp. AGMB00827]|uniref:B3/B4 tRNA-binding domain-containing protein n=1 Tax=Collinsella ureilytica TaxID=2869515 RepID=A0ABS7MJ90_9ACTN|nr:phenylalanine--tRNA ligase beta subunit-related protein [Collinsella urealyticum]MBY4797426.1 hypothetical protein [Collinsella urealyticum]
MKQLICEESFWELFPEAIIGVVVARDLIDGTEMPEEDREELAAMLAKANRQAERFLTSEVISENAPVRIWREAYRRFKTKRGVRSAFENLLKRVLKGRPVGSISPSVDLCNAVSLSYAFPIGGFDLDRIEGDYLLKVTEGGDSFLPIGEEENDPTLPGELAYVDEAGATSRCWNWRDCQRTELGDATKNVVIIFECIEPDRADDAKEAVRVLAERLKRHFKAQIVLEDLITTDQRSVVLEP